MYPENEYIEAWLQKELPEEVLEPDLEIVDPVRSAPAIMHKLVQSPSATLRQWAC